MKRLRLTTVGLWLLLILLTVWPAMAQVQDDAWSEPVRLSTQDGVVTFTGGRIVADPFGTVHVLWAETLPGGETIIQYTTFNGRFWEIPIDIYVTRRNDTFGFLSEPVIDPANNTLNVAWTGGTRGPIVVMQAPLQEANNARAWTVLSSLNQPAYEAHLQIDSQGVYHLLFRNVEGLEPGLYYTQSADKGDTWRTIEWIDPEIPVNYIPDNVIFTVDESTDRLHILYRYARINDDTTLSGMEIGHRYSADSGQSWSRPTVIDIADEDPSELRAKDFVFAAQDHELHAIWVGTNDTRREHVYSLDGGETWSTPTFVFDKLQGSAGDSLIFDGAGNLHFLGQIRYPQGMWDIVWDGQSWGEPELVYLIRETDEDEYRGIHIHNIKTAVNLGNQLVTLITNSPGEGHLELYAMYRQYESVPAMAPLPLPTAVPTAEPTAAMIETAVPLEPTPINHPDFDRTAAVTTPSPADSIWISALPALIIVLLVAGATIYWRQQRQQGKQ